MNWRNFVDCNWTQPKKEVRIEVPVLSAVDDQEKHRKRRELMEQFVWDIEDSPKSLVPIFFIRDLLRKDPVFKSQFDDIALEFTFVYDQGNNGTYETSKRIADAGNKLTTSNSTDIFSAVVAANDPSGVVDGYRFQCVTSDITVSTFPNAKFVMIQNYLNGTKIGFKASNSAQMPPQGKIITSTARAKATNGVSISGSPTPIPQTGLTRVTQIFQSYPQIPSEFWTTSF